MNARERIDAAIRGAPVDRVPWSMWLHNFAREHSAALLAEETCRLQEKFEFDLLKPQSRAFCFGQMWGQEYRVSTRADEWPVVTRHAVRDAHDLARIGPADGTTGALREQAEALRLIRRQVGPDVPIVATVFAPMMNLVLMNPGGMEAALQWQRSAPAELERALAHLCDTLVQFTAMCIDEGVDGIFYAVTTANRGQCSIEEFQRFQRPFDERILDAAARGSTNMLHLCGGAIQADWFANYRAQLVSWATTPGNPGLSQMHRKSGKAVVGGIPGKPAFGQMSAAQIASHVAASLIEMNGRAHILGPDCSVNPGVDEDLMLAVKQQVQSFRPTKA